MIRALAFVVCLAAAPAAVADVAPEPEPRPGQSIVFDVYRGNAEFGEHRVEFSEEEDALKVDVSIRLRAGLGPITMFRYEHESTERWRGDELVSLRARTLKDGETYRVAAERTREGLRVRGEDEAGAFDELFQSAPPPSSHWHRYGVELDRMISTETGRPLPVDVQYLGEERIAGDGGTIRAHRFRVVSDITVDLWYDENGHWAGCAFEARGQSIRYVRRAPPQSFS
ncbi:hypothetical protein DDZ18_05475 [Marinicauda salina]|uniref:DUF3108 domain-containing protein n=1 Tax=Marinicauda salina TaxID=2135793 RepID=A0A2U2BVK4_9PROT|nr:DUF6134 family protein [Marinicauda salina]PWE18020.1 hypothetical protein DDZ18_05475 [Marinicauda salina]